MSNEPLALTPYDDILPYRLRLTFPGVDMVAENIVSSMSVEVMVNLLLKLGFSFTPEKPATVDNLKGLIVALTSEPLEIDGIEEEYKLDDLFEQQPEVYLPLVLQAMGILLEEQVPEGDIRDQSSAALFEVAQDLDMVDSLSGIRNIRKVMNERGIWQAIYSKDGRAGIPLSEITTQWLLALREQALNNQVIIDFLSAIPDPQMRASLLGASASQTELIVHQANAGALSEQQIQAGIAEVASNPLGAQLVMVGAESTRDVIDAVAIKLGTLSN